jgi:hypothetical protein
MTMKNLLLIGAFLLILTGCTKQAVLPEEKQSSYIAGSANAEDVIATVTYLGDPAADGLGWALMIEKEVEIPINLPDSYKKEGLNVRVSFRRTEQRVPCRCAEPKYYVEITSISPATK